MLIQAKFPSTCPTCGRYINVGDKVEWSKGQKARHARCAGATPSTPSSTVPDVPKGTNRRAGSCERCGHYLKIGEGRLIFCVEDSGCLRHHDESGYHLYCQDKDSTSCKERVTENKKAEVARAEAARQEETQRKNAEKQAQAKRDEIVSGFIATETFDGKVWTRGEKLASGKDYYDWSLFAATRKDGSQGFIMDSYGYDDYRSSLYTSQDVIDSEHDAWATQYGITTEKAQEWLSRYTGCSGADAYRRVLVKAGISSS